jgi:prepilin-type N-terminal cleavage/methylation domain-containing protein
MNMKFQVERCRLQVFPSRRRWVAATFNPRRAFTLVEVLVVMALLSLIVLALMAVFNSTQAAFRSGVTESGVLETGRAVADIMAADLRAMSPAGENNTNGVNFYVGITNYPWAPSPLLQPMVGGTSVRTNVLENIFILSRGISNGVPTWNCVGYAVTATNTSGGLYSLYRFATNHPASLFDPAYLFTNDFAAFLANVGSTNVPVTIGGSHLLDGVVHLTARAYDVNGGWMRTNQVVSGLWTNYNQDVYYYTNNYAPTSVEALSGEVGLAMFSNTLPATVEIDMGVLEDRPLARAQSLTPSLLLQSNYLSSQASKVHIFRQRVAIPGMEPSAYVFQ